MGVAHQPHIVQVGDGLKGTLLGDPLSDNEASQRVQRFGLDELGRVHWRLRVINELLLDGFERVPAPEQEVGQDGGVDDDQRRSRSFRITAELDGPL